MSFPVWITSVRECAKTMVYLLELARSSSPRHLGLVTSSSTKRWFRQRNASEPDWRSEILARGTAGTYNRQGRLNGTARVRSLVLPAAAERAHEVPVGARGAPDDVVDEPLSRAIILRG